MEILYLNMENCLKLTIFAFLRFFTHLRSRSSCVDWHGRIRGSYRELKIDQYDWHMMDAITSQVFADSFFCFLPVMVPLTMLWYFVLACRSYRGSSLLPDKDRPGRCLQHLRGFFLFDHNVYVRQHWGSYFCKCNNNPPCYIAGLFPATVRPFIG